jgi:translocation and assembly module TamB
LSLSYFSIDDPVGDQHVLGQYELVGYGRLNFDGAHELFVRANTVYLDYAGGDSFEIQSLAVKDAQSSAALKASGRVAVGGEQPVLDLDATWAQLQWPLRGKPQVASESGSLRLKGTPHDYTIALDGGLALADGTNGQVRVSGAGNAEALALDHVDIEALRGRIAGRMNVRWAPSLSGAIELSGTALDPGVVKSPAT